MTPNFSVLSYIISSNVKYISSFKSYSICSYILYNSILWYRHLLFSTSYYSGKPFNESTVYDIESYLIALSPLHYYSIRFYCIISILFCSILFYSILFYSVLFYSILFLSIVSYSIILHFIRSQLNHH